ETLQHEINQILRLLREDTKDYTDILKLKVKELLLYLINGTSSEYILNFIYSCTHKIDTLQQYMEQNYEQNQNIPNLANALNMSTSTFKRKFVQMYGVTPGKWLNSKRLQKAANLLRTTDYLITDICFLCGFESVSTFNVQFKKNFGMSPGQFSKIKA
ncbi:MAG TPA: AraC family transcriptional regulator, partial [Clostridia bacterium]|nr:AraC family transcriptional regulator [Clostridia bacterium]